MNVPQTGNPYFLGFLIAVTAGFAWLLTPLFGAVFWAAAFAVVFVPLHRRLVRRFHGRETLAAFVTLMICVALVIVPTLLLATALVTEGAGLVDEISRSGGVDVNSVIEQLRHALPASVRTYLDRIVPADLAGIRQKLTDFAVTASQFVAAKAYSIGQDTVQFVISLAVMAYLLFFLLRDGDHLIGRLVHVVPLEIGHSQRLLATFATVVRATIRGNLVVAVVQGLLGGCIFWALGLERAVLWGAIMALLSVLPAVGSALIWAPAGLYLLATGDLWRGIALLAFGGGVISMVDNLLRPILVGKDTRMPDYVVLIATIGGLSLFGLNGAVIGPLIAGLFIAAWSLFSDGEGTSGEVVAEEAGGQPQG